LRWKQWSGYFVAVAYDDFHDPESHAIRTGAGLIDVSPLYKYDIQGPDALRLVDRLITRDASKCQVGQVLYAAWCDEGGKVIQDGCFQRLAKDHFRASAADRRSSGSASTPKGWTFRSKTSPRSTRRSLCRGPVPAKSCRI
jgi:aminomethyltransferase